MFRTTSQTKTENTRKEYLKRAGKRLAKYVEETGNDVSENGIMVERLSQYLRVQRVNNNYKQNTWRKIRAELKCYFEEHGMKSNVRMINELPRLKIIEEATKESKKSYKHLPIKITEKIIEQLIKNKDSETSLTLIHWIYATRIVGVRPCEWISARLKKDFEVTNEDGSKGHMAVLQIDNAKNTNGRTFGDKRQIILADVTPEEMKHIDYMYELVTLIRKTIPEESWKNAWQLYYEKCRSLLYRTNKKVRPKGKINVTLYSARHQFAADFKATELSEYEGAALMGHGSIATADRHYGLKHLGDKDRFRVRAPKHLVKKVLEKTSRAAMEKRKKSEMWLSENRNIQSVVEKIADKLEEK